MVCGHKKAVVPVGSERHHIVVIDQGQLDETVTALVKHEQFSSTRHNASVFHLAYMLHGAYVSWNRFEIVGSLAIQANAFVGAYP